MPRDVVDAIKSLLEYRTKDLGCYEFVLESWMEKAANEIEHLRAERQWIPATQRMPDDGVVVMAWNGKRVVFGYSRDGRWIDTLYGWVIPNGPTHWMPLPEPPAIGIK